MFILFLKGEIQITNNNESPFLTYQIGRDEKI